MEKQKTLILVIDDEDIVRDLAQSILKFFEYESLAATNGDEGVALFQANKDKIDAVLCDMVMPTLNGEEVFHAIRKIQPTVPIILSSGLEDPALISRLKSQGLAGFLNKPYQPAELIAKLNEIIESSSS
ncbi:MAG: response regulator [Planctomycetota bacterium]|nr:response regulator [Planctomycetota bacterium]